MSSNLDRDYYKHLFTPESESDESSSSCSHSQISSGDLCEYDLFSDFIAQEGNNILESSVNYQWPECFHSLTGSDPSQIQKWLEEDDLELSELDFDFEDSTTPSQTKCDKNPPLSQSLIEEEDNFPPTMLQFLQEDDVLDLLGQKEQQTPNVPKTTTNKPLTADKIGCYNIQNKFDHNTAAELFIREDMTFLALQEPYAGNYSENASWESFQQLELQNARISSFITQHQIILFDNWKWGGKTMEQFESFAHGRVTSIAFDLGNEQKIGIISVYASTVEALQEAQYETEGKTNIISSAEIIDKIKTRWNRKYKDNICIIIMGDFQETMTQTDRDNLGACRYATPRNGIINLIQDSRKSIIRDSHPNQDYITRIGKEGGRGIDHIMTPIHPKFKNWFPEAQIHRFLGQTYFPSDHSLLICHFNRQGPNNNENGTEKRKFDYKQISRIKLTRSGPNKDFLQLDGNQFKNCKKFEEQKELYQKIQKLTGDNSDTTNYLLDDIKRRTKGLFKQLWYAGLCQEVNGQENKLIRISEEHAVEIAHITQRFNIAIKDVMQSLSLTNDVEEGDRAGNVRGKLRKREGFKRFSNLPIAMKLRYLRLQLTRKARLIIHDILWLKEYEIHLKHNRNPSNWSEFVQILIILNNTSDLERKAKILVDAALEEAIERESHVETIHCMKKGPKHPDIPDDGEKAPLPNVPDIFIEKINKWLQEAKCKQLFGISHSSDQFRKISDCVSSWKTFSSGIDIECERMEDQQFRESSSIELNKAQTEIKKLIGKTSQLQYFYKKSTLQFFLDTNKICDFTRKMLPKSRTAPSTHTRLWDDSIGDFRNCINEEEELIATKNHHGHWMGNSRAKEVCAFARVRSEGRLGYRGVDLFPERVITEKDISSLVHSGDKLPKKLKTAFVKAHGNHIRQLFQPPKEDCKELFYPFYLRDKLGKMNEDETIGDCFWNAISSIPTKARHDGFQLAVLGRFGRRWQLQLLAIAKLILIMRYVPHSLKKMARYPIPKPGKVNEYRPISLCNDLYCFLNGIITKYTSAGIEKAKILHDGIVAYRRGRGCHSLVTIEQCFREDCVAGGWPAVQLDEDEEKFFDRVPVAILLAAMRVNGFPLQGYLEFKASAMGAKDVEIITCKGVTYAKFICGLEQGNPDSPTVANLVIKFKHDAWSYISDEIRKIFQSQNDSHDGKYVFNSVDPVDGEVMICKIGYCDDNTKFIRVRNENDLIKLVTYYLQLAGDLSMVTKIGRKGSKCDIQFFNISAEMTMKLKKCISVAWSFINDSPVEESVPFRVHLNTTELTKLKNMIKYDDLDLVEKIKWDKIIDSDAHKHLGLIGKMSGCTAETSTYFLQKMRNRLAQLNIRSMDVESQRKCINMLVNTIHSYIPLQANHLSQDLFQFDNLIAQTIRKTNGISASDSKHRIFIPENKGGLGISSAMEIDVISVARELEIVSNSCALDSFAFRTRVQDAKNPHARINDENHEKFFNHAKEAILKLARYGIHFRDRQDGLVNDIIAYFSHDLNLISIGHKDYSNGNNHSIGFGNQKQRTIAFGGPMHEAALILKNNGWKISKEMKGLDNKSPIKFDTMIEKLPTIKNIKIRDIEKLFTCWEWTNSDTNPSFFTPTAATKWDKINLNLRSDETFK